MRRTRRKIEEIFSQCLVVSGIFFVAGVGTELFFPKSGTLAGLAIAAAWVLLWGVSGQRVMIARGVASVLFFFVGASAGVTALANADTVSLSERAINGKGVIVDDVSIGDFSQRISVKILVCEGVLGCAGERIAISTNRFRLFSFGDTVAFSCVPERVKNFSDTFDFRMYLATKGIRATCEDPNVRIVSEKKTLWGFLGSTRRALEKNVNRFVSEPMAALGNGLLFGGSSRMSEALSDDFSKTSMTHITAVSGYNIAIVSTYLFSLAIFFGWWRRGATVIALSGIVVFVLLVGSPSSGIRAGVMGGIVLLTMLFGRTDASLRALAYAGSIMVALNPLIVRYDTGFQLSLLATLGIVLFSPGYERIRPSGAWARSFADIAYATIAAQLFVIPVLLATFGSFSFTSFAANLCVLWTLPWAMLFVFCTAVSGGIFDFLGFLSGVFAQSILWYDIYMIRFFARISEGTIFSERVSAGFLIVWYFVVTGGAVWLRMRESRRMRLLCRRRRDIE